CKFRLSGALTNNQFGLGIYLYTDAPVPDGVCNQVNHLIPTRVLVKGGEITCKILK
ncbi:hypothetical protein ACS13F_005361, partial [Escherichia coli]